MTKWLRIVEPKRHRAADRVHELVSLLRIALGSWTPVSGALSPDDLPISFILRRDSPMTKRRRGRRSSRTSLSVRTAYSHFKTHAVGGRPAPRNTLRSESHPTVRAGGDHHRRYQSGSGRSHQQAT
jgi:hypothetical protein